MELSERSYSASTFRPKPLIQWESQNQLLIVATNWGIIDSTQKIISGIAKHVTTNQDDLEKTTPFIALTQLTSQTNSLRSACQIVNDLIFRGDNKVEFVAGAEICVLLKTQSQLSWLQVGQPHLFMKRKNTPLQPLSIAPDLSFDSPPGQTDLIPLPKDLIGIESTCTPHTGSCLIFPGDQLLMVSRSEVPFDICSNVDGSLGLAEITQTLSQQYPKSPFWLGLLSLD
jgi:hypothetical protein